LQAWIPVRWFAKLFHGSVLTYRAVLFVGGLVENYVLALLSEMCIVNLADHFQNLIGRQVVLNTHTKQIAVYMLIPGF
jgi:hypothetical protein